MELADYSASMDLPSVRSKFAIVASDDLHFGLGRMYGAYRDLKGSEAKTVQVFRTREEAEKWLND